MGSHIENSAIKAFESNFTGNRVSKLQFITVKAVRKDEAVVFYSAVEVFLVVKISQV